MKRDMAVLVASIVITALVVSGIWYAVGPAILQPKVVEKPVGKLEAVTLLFPWVPNGEFVPLYVALHEGFFANQGLAVTLIGGRGSSFAATTVDQNKVDFAWADTVLIILQVAKGAKIKIVASIANKHPGALASFGQLKTPRDLEGKTVGISPFSSSRFLIPLIMQMNGADPKKMHEVLTDPSVLTQQFISGRVDVDGEAWLGSDLPEILSLANKAGKQVNVLTLADFGLNLPFYQMIASEKMISEKPDLVSKMVKATLQGIDASLNMPNDQIVDIVLRYEPTLPRDITLQQWTQIKSSFTRYGPVDGGVIKNSVEVVQKAYNMTEKIDPSALYTNQFVK